MLFEDDVPELVRRRSRSRRSPIGALVPAAIMSIAAANLLTRNIYKAFFRPEATRAGGAGHSKLASLVVKFGALIFVLVPRQELRHQLPAARWHLDPADVPGARVRSLHPLVPPAGHCSLGWAVGMVYGTWSAYMTSSTRSPQQRTSAARSANIPLLGDKGYIALTAFVMNVVIAAALTLRLPGAQARRGQRPHGSGRLPRRRGRARCRAHACIGRGGERRAVGCPDDREPAPARGPRRRPRGRGRPRPRRRDDVHAVGRARLPAVRRGRGR